MSNDDQNNGLAIETEIRVLVTQHLFEHVFASMLSHLPDGAVRLDGLKAAMTDGLLRGAASDLVAPHRLMLKQQLDKCFLRIAQLRAELIAKR